MLPTSDSSFSYIKQIQRQEMSECSLFSSPWVFFLSLFQRKGPNWSQESCLRCLKKVLPQCALFICQLIVYSDAIESTRLIWEMWLCSDPNGNISLKNYYAAAMYKVCGFQLFHVNCFDFKISISIVYELNIHFFILEQFFWFIALIISYKFHINCFFLKKRNNKISMISSFQIIMLYQTHSYWWDGDFPTICVNRFCPHKKVQSDTWDG